MRRRGRPRYASEATSELILARRRGMEECILRFSSEIALVAALYPESEWVFGRLFCVGLLDQQQYYAVELFYKVLQSYRSFIAPHAKVKLSNLESMRIAVREDLSPAAERRLKKVQEEYGRLLKAVKSCPRRHQEVFFRCLEDDVLPSDLESVYWVVDALIRA